MSEELQEDAGDGEWGRILLRLVVAAVVLGAAYVGAAFYLGQHVANGTTVAGVDIGGRTPESAEERLRSRLEDMASAPVEVQVGEDIITLDPRRAGLELDLEATLEGATGITYDPAQMWRHLSDGGRSLPLQVSVDERQLTAALERAATHVDTEVVPGSVAFANGQVQTTMSRPGRSLDVAATAEAVQAAWTRRSTIAGVVRVDEPELTAEEIARFTEEFAEPAMSAPVRVVVDGESTTLSPAQLSRVLSVEPDGPHGLGARLDAEALTEMVRDGVPDVERAPQNATVALADGRPQVVPGVRGAAIDQEAVIEAVREALTSDQRTAATKTRAVEPEVTAADARGWGVDEVLAEFRSTFPTGPANEARTHNIRVGLSHLNGVLVRPGEQFSLLSHLAPFTAGMGYREAGVIVDGRLTEGMGGGLSQVSTVVFNTAFFAGVQLDEHTAHAYYIARYPEGREATLWAGGIDNRWTNDSGHAILVQTWIEGDEIVMRFWGTKTYDVTATKSPRRNVVQPERIVDDSPACMPQAPVDGFDVTVGRVFHQNGEPVRRQELTTHYQPSDRVICTHPAAG